ncbi:hypothetical protein [Planctomycetes bacterium K23_9]|uniref:Secreted protein n=1 Tax=Stieleria marina TaxID=1930275 RepID=A0A517NU31_9BACT|nr:hypothetical protein K239x_25910 [Planctomycetes bacterium K23_9]
MKRTTQWMMMFLVAGWAVLQADEPAADDSRIAIPETIQPIPMQPDAAGKIQAALDGQRIQTGDGVLDDVLQIARQRGSILDGSSLDVDLDSSQESDPSAKHSNRPSGKQSAVTEACRTAESLLKSARLLEKMATLDDDQVNLIRQLRRQSLRLLSEQIATDAK